MAFQCTNPEFAFLAFCCSLKWNERVKPTVAFTYTCWSVGWLFAINVMPSAPVITHSLATMCITLMK